VKAYWISVLVLVVVSGIAGGILVSTNPTTADATLSHHDTTRL
jgi:hypothetical protein